MTQDKNTTLGSLFDGIGGFPYAASFYGIRPLWASEILPQAVSVTMRHFPDMEHVGDITALDGAKLPPVDIITFGSPCQDLSTAGRRLGLQGERSGLFTEAIRIIDEMRRATNGKYPRYALWENVPGAMSSGKPAGSDFRAVLEAFAKPKFQCLLLADGRMPAWCEAMVLKSLGGCLTPNISESPSGGGESFLSAILEEKVPEKYCLSKKACEGILRRAAKRGKQLPPMLQEALEMQVKA